jgi:nucleotide-binding universal stress UspA family protein
MFTKILVPLDGSELSERALLPALAIASKPGASLTLLRVPLAPTGWDRGIEGSDPYIEAWAEEHYANERAAAADYLTKIKQAREQDGLPIATQLVEGDVAAQILKAAQQNDLVVMSTHGYSGLTKWMMGSVAEKVLGTATCPVLVLRSSQPIRKMLIPLDGSELSESALAPGLELALRLHSEVTLFRIVEEVSKFERAQLAGLGDTDIASRLQNGLVTEAENYLESLVLPAPEAGLDIKKVVLVSHTPAPRILDYADQNGVDLIVMATHGRTGLSKWAYGSVTEKVLRRTQSSLMVIRPAKQRLH